MLLRPPRSARTDTRCPYTTLCRSEAAFNRILRWTNGSFEIQPAQPERARRIEQSWQGLLLNTAQEIDESRGAAAFAAAEDEFDRSEEHTSALQSLMRISYAVFCLKKQTHKLHESTHNH